MSEIFEKIKKPMIVLAVLIGGYILYNTFIKTDASTTLLKKENVADAKTPDESLIPLLLKIQNVTLDEKLFLDPVFRALVDRSQNIVPEAVGKQNPFSGALLSDVVSNVENLGFVDQSTIASSTSPATATKPVTPAPKAPIKPKTSVKK